MSMGKHTGPAASGKRCNRPSVPADPGRRGRSGGGPVRRARADKRGQFEVIHTADPAEALRLAAAEHWDLLLTDLDLPGMTGLELLAALRQVAPALPVAVTSAHALDGTLPSLLGHADEYLEKPLRVDKLIATATALIGQGRRPQRRTRAR